MRKTVVISITTKKKSQNKTLKDITHAKSAKNNPSIERATLTYFLVVSLTVLQSLKIHIRMI